MNKASRFLLLLLLVSFNWSLLKAQVYIGYDVGISNHTLSDEYFGDNYYEQLDPTALNLNILILSEKRIFNIRFNGINTVMDPVLEQINYHSINYVKLSDYSFDIEYLGKDREITNRLILFLGGSINGRYFSSTRKLDSNFSNEQSNSRELTNINLSLNGLLRYSFNRFSINYNSEFGFLNFVFKTNKYDQYVEDSEFKIAGFNEYLEFENSISGNFELSDRITIKSEFLVRYFKFTDGYQSKVLSQSILIGGMVRLW